MYKYPEMPSLYSAKDIRGIENFHNQTGFAAKWTVAFLETKWWYFSDAEYKIVLKVIDLLYIRSAPRPGEVVSAK